MDKVLIVDENKQTRDVLVTYLRDIFEVHHCGVQESVQKAYDTKPVAVVFSIEKLFPLKQIVSDIRNKPELSQVAVVALVDDSNPRTLEFLFDCGVDDSIAYPIDFHKLYWKLKSLLRRIKGELSQKLLVSGDFKLDLENNLVSVAGREQPVTGTQMNLLKCFIQSSDRLITREWLKNTVWGAEEISERSIDAHVSKLKKILPEIEAHLESVYGKGYIWKSKKAANKAAI